MSSRGASSVTQCLELIQAGLAGLAECDLDGYTADGLGDECVRLLRLTGELNLQVARRLPRFEALGGPAADGAHSLTGWLGHRARLRPWEARQLCVTAERLHLLDETIAAHTAGAVEFGDVATVAEGVDKAITVLEEDTAGGEWPAHRIAEVAQPILLRAAQTVTPGQLRRAALRVALTLDTGDGGEQRRKRIERASFLSLGQTLDGVGSMRADMSAGDFAVLEKTVDTFTQRPTPGQPAWSNVAGHRRLKGLITACEIALNTAARHGYRERGGAPIKVHVITTAPHPPSPATPTTKRVACSTRTDHLDAPGPSTAPDRQNGPSYGTRTDSLDASSRDTATNRHDTYATATDRHDACDTATDRHDACDTATDRHDACDTATDRRDGCASATERLDTCGTGTDRHDGCGCAPATERLDGCGEDEQPAWTAGRTEFGTVLTAADVREMTRRHHTEVTLVRIRADGSAADRHTADGRPLNWGRTRRLFTSDQRDVYLALYAGCAAPGCDRPIAWSAIDHKQAWTQGGTTDLANGQPLCDWHNLNKEHHRTRRPHDKTTKQPADDPP